MQTRLPGCVDDRFLGRLQLAVANILLDAAGEDVILLHHETDVFAHPVSVVLAQIASVQQHAAACRFVKPGQQIHCRTLARARESHQRGRLAALQVEIDALQRLLTIRVDEVDTIKREVTAQHIARHSASFWQVAVALDHLEEAFGVRQRFRVLVVNAVQMPHRRRDIAEERQMQQNRAVRHLVIEHEPDGQREDRDDPELLDGAFQSVEQIVGAVMCDLARDQTAIDRLLAARLVTLAHERLHHKDRLEQSEQRLRFLLAHTLNTPADAGLTLRLRATDEREHGKHDGCDGADPHIALVHQPQCECGVDQHRQNIDEDILDRLRDALDALVDALFELPRLVLRQRKERQMIRHDPMNRVVVQITGKPEPETIAQVLLPQLQQQRQQLAAEEQRRKPADALPDLPVAQRQRLQLTDGVHRALHHQWRHQRQQAADQCQQQRQRQAAPVLPDEWPQLPDEMKGVHARAATSGMITSAEFGGVDHRIHRRHRVVASRQVSGEHEEVASDSTGIVRRAHFERMLTLRQRIARHRSVPRSIASFRVRLPRPAVHPTFHRDNRNARPETHLRLRWTSHDVLRRRRQNLPPRRRDLHHRSAILHRPVHDRQRVVVDRHDRVAGGATFRFANRSRRDVHVARIVRHLAVVCMARENGSDRTRLHDLPPRRHPGRVAEVLHDLKRIVVLEHDHSFTTLHRAIHFVAEPEHLFGSHAEWLALH